MNHAPVGSFSSLSFVDGGDELEKSESLVDVCSDNSSRGISSKAIEDTADVGDDESSNVVSEGVLPDSDLRDYQSDVKNDISVDAASAFLVCENCNLEGTCLLCSKSKRYNPTSYSLLCLTTYFSPPKAPWSGWHIMTAVK